MKHLFIVNPVAGGRKSRYEDTIKRIEDAMRSVAEEYEIYVTKAPLDACSKIREAAKSGEEMRVYACGGDGTFNECVNGAVGLCNVSVACYPCGTGNDFIKTFGHDAAHFKDIRALAQGEARPIDVIDCNGRCCANICSVGIDAKIAADVHKYSGIPLIGGAAGYVVSMLVNIFKGINSRLKIRTDGLELDSEFALICGCNGRYYGGGFNPVPDAVPDDGLIDFLVIKEVSLFTFLRLVGKYAKGRYRELPQYITHVAGKFMEIESDKEIVVNIDGEAIREKRVVFRMVEKGFNMVFPRTGACSVEMKEKIKA